MQRRISKKIKVGNIFIGGDAPVTVQSMLNVPSTDIEGSVKQAAELEKAGCEIIRAAVPDMAAVKLISRLKENLTVPVVADIHFDHRLALESLEAGVDKIRINPGNIGSMDKVRLVARKCKNKGVPIRIGVNGGSLEKEILAKYSSPSAEALCESAMGHVKILEQCDFDDIVISIKSSDVETMIKAYRLVAGQCGYPLHLGVTEAGTYNSALIKSSIGIGSLLCDGIGDTIRVSMTAQPLSEVYAGIEILKAAGIRTDCPSIVSCPTCGRTRIDLIALANGVEERLKSVKKGIKVAVMGCVVNGPGEAREADIGIAGGDGCAVIFKKGEILRKVDEKNALDSLMEEIEKL
ncbi:MAG: flavodoxin-dependent (E)-4-hydroxy-3-methylbut-2-enyl-diphosphate synthase [Clostridiales bacterium]|nr:flavodoxin-dependent (E)-4-hydroxy-3-methylbut-2-enyl-diphosphate synthase [Clostridiales bacterium]